jgi:hypothetical protein
VSDTNDANHAANVENRAEIDGASRLSISTLLCKSTVGVQDKGKAKSVYLISR